MEKTFRYFFIILLMVIICSESFSQQKQKKSQNLPVALRTDDNNFSKTPSVRYSKEEQDIIDQMEQIKQTGTSSNEGEKILDLQKQLESLSGSSVTRTETEPLGTLIPASNYNHQQTDNIFNTGIGDQSNYITGIATQVEQRGTTAGKIWAAIGLTNGDTGVAAKPDTLAVYYSSNNGISYNLYAKIAFGSHNKFDRDNIDMEIIENTSGTKYLYIVFGYVTNGGYGQRLIGYTILTAPSLSYSGSTLFFPGYTASSSYRNARITSDNARYPGVPYVTIVVTQDSIAGGNDYVMSKICRALSPFTLNPSITYLPKSIYSPIPGGDGSSTFMDVANYHNGNDSLIYLLSNYSGYKQNLYFYKAFSNTTVYPGYNGTLTPTGDNLSFASIAANGGTNQPKIMVTYSDDYLNSGDLDQWILKSTDASNWTASTLNYLSSDISTSGDIIGRRSADGSFAVTFKNTYGHEDNISTFSFTNLGVSSSIYSLNDDFANALCGPKPGFRFTNGDSCLSIWSNYYFLYSTEGCSASNLFITMAIQGFYDQNTGVMSKGPGVYAYLANPNPPYNIVDTALAYVNYDLLTNVFAFPRALSGNYYLIVKEYTCLETWSAAPVYVNPNTPGYYDFTSSSSQAYGNNMIQKGSKWCLYTGDINDDGVVDLADITLVYNDALNFVFGENLADDLNGDGFIDGTDILLAYNNAIDFVGVIRP